MRARLVFGHDPGPLTGAGSNAWFLPGGIPTLIDACSGRPPQLEALVGVVNDEEPPTTVAQVLVTHAHPDHAGGAAAIAVRWPTARFRKLPWPEGDERYPVAWEALRDGEMVRAGDQDLWVVHTPGHAPDHVCFFEPRSGTLFAGDLVMSGGTIVIPASIGGSLRQYMESLERVLELQPRRVLPGHGPVIDHPVSLLQGYLAHRRAREQQILTALAGGTRSVAEIVARVYEGLQPELVPAAGESVLAHLRKLEDEGRARQEAAGPGVRWRLT
jgi:glyoxylase-like metal-dependent hydrolase (beta-lactamase superfamily II)